MARVISNIQVNDHIGLLEVEAASGGAPGQFYMLRAWNAEPLLPRAISIFDVKEHSIQFLYQVVGEGTRQLYRLRPGEDLQLTGPSGNGFPQLTGRVALVGGGIGVAPFYYAARQYKSADLYLGFSEQPYLVEEFNQMASSVTVDVGGSILGRLVFSDYDHVIACGPSGMLKAVQMKQAAEGSRTNVYISVENKMACAVGACLACSIQHHSGRVQTCTDGPVFRAEEVTLL